MVENFPSLAKETDVQVQEAHRVPNKMNPKRITPGCTIIKMSNLKVKNLKGGKRKTTSYIQGNPFKTIS